MRIPRTPHNRVQKDGEIDPPSLQEHARYAEFRAADISLEDMIGAMAYVGLRVRFNRSGVLTGQGSSAGLTYSRATISQKIGITEQYILERFGKLQDVRQAVALVQCWECVQRLRRSVGKKTRQLPTTRPAACT